MKSRISILAVMAIVLLSSCGSNSSGGSTPPPGNEWTWVGGSNATNQTGTYGTLGVASPRNVPGARQQAVSWTDASGNFWLFGGTGYDSSGNPGTPLNDLWKYSAGQWTWMSGSNVEGQSGVYGTRGVAAAGNVPGARFGAIGSTDRAGNLWLFGGYFISPNGPSENGLLNDLWKYGAGEWTWISGSDTLNQVATYGTQGIAAPGNVPGARSGATSWIDASGNFWLFGGSGVISSGNCCAWLNDLWEYSSGQWTWIGGSQPLDNPQGVYGTQGIASPANIPGARSSANSWVDASGNFWLFGGDGVDSGGEGYLNDLWKYSAGEWTWMSGSSSPDQVGTYGTKGISSPANVPGARYGAVTWTDASGNLWLFSGASNYPGVMIFNDLWKCSAGQWTWMGGSISPDQAGTYGTEGVASPANVPGARFGAVGWTDESGNFWLFGGQYGMLNTTSQNPPVSFNDLWMYQP